MRKCVGGCGIWGPRIHGAKHVDLFDISYNAQCLTHIKTAALGCLTRDEYIELLKNLCSSEDVLAVPNMDKISKKLSKVELDYLAGMRGYKVFGRRVWVGNDDPLLPTEQEYAKLQEIVKEPYNFSVTDLAHLSTHLTSKYDFIHLSNVPDYIETPELRFRVIYSLANYLNIGGRIVCEHMTKADWPDSAPVSDFKGHIKDYRETLKKYGPDLDDFCKNLLQEEIDELKDMCRFFRNYKYQKLADEKLVVFTRVR